MKIQLFKMRTILLVVALVLSFTSTISQVVPYWRLNGNPLFGIDGVNAGNNFFGTAVGNATSLRFGTNGTSQMILQNGTGFLGIGTANPQNLLHIDDGINSFLQVTNGGSGNLATDGVKFGMLGNTPNALIAQQENFRLLFTTGGANLATTRICVLGALGPTQGFVGIGAGYINPNNLLDVNGGDIDVNTPQRSYMIGDQSVLWHKGNNDNIFVGVGAGQNHGFNLASRNTYVGKNAGFSGTGILTPSSENNENVIIGWNAGFNNDNKRATIVGVEAGFSSSAGQHVLIGYRAGYSWNTPLTPGTTNTFIGYESGFAEVSAMHNTYLGFMSGQNSNGGEENTFIGNVSGQNNSTGERNTFVGFVSGNGNGAFNQNVYIGNRSGAVSVGDENTFVGSSSGLNGGGIKNVVMGFNAFSTSTVGLENVIVGNESNLTGQNNNFNNILGSQSAPVLVNSNLNTLAGHRTAFNQTAGLSNSYFGENTGVGVLTGTNNTFIGAKADVTNINSTTVTNAAAIGANAKVTNANHMILGDNNVNVGIGLSSDPAGPGNKLEINTAAATAIPGASGLRFRDLNITSTAGVNPGPGVLSVDTNGDVIYVLGGGTGSAFGNLCSATPNPITGHFEMPLGNVPNAFNYYFTGQNLLNDKVSVGFPCNTVLRGRLNSLQNISTTHAQETISGYFLNTDVNGDNQDTLTGAWGQASGIQPTADNTNIGGNFYGLHARTNIGVQGIGSNTTAQPIPASICYGGRFVGANSNSNSYGVWARATGAGVNYAGYFDGDVFINGIGTGALGIFYASDQMFKTNIDTIVNAQNIIKQLKPRTYYFDTTNANNINFSEKKQYGLIAQDVELILPELVDNTTKPAEYDSLGNVTAPAVTYKNLNYNAFIAILIRGMQVQQKAIDSLTTKTNKQDSVNNAVQAQIAALTSSITSCCSSSAVRTVKSDELNQLDIKLSDKDVIVLNQNVPNPFAEQTTITYNVPEKYNFAQIIFSTIDGKIIKAVDITKKGKGQLNVFANDLSTGFYTYSLVVDGKVMDTKKMVKSE